MVDLIKTPLDRQHLHVNDNSGHDTFPRNNAGRVVRNMLDPEAQHCLYTGPY